MPLLILLIIGGTAVYGATLWIISLPGSVTFAASPYETKLFSDALCTVPMTNVAFGILVQGGQTGSTLSALIPGYLQLQGTSAIDLGVVITAANLPTGATVAVCYKNMDETWSANVYGLQFVAFKTGVTRLVDGKAMIPIAFQLSFLNTATKGTFNSITFTITTQDKI